MKKALPLKPIVAAIMAALVSNCASAPPDVPDVAGLTEQALVSSRPPSLSVVEIVDEPYVISEPIPTTPWKKYGNISLNVQEQNFYDLIYAIAKDKDIGLSVNSDVIVDRGITITLSYVSPIEAIKRIAEAAGYVAVYSPGTKQITLSRRAVFSFKLPKSVFDTLSDTEQLISTETIAINQGSANIEEDIHEKLSRLVGPDAQVNVFAASGIVTVSGDVRTLSLIHAFLNDYLAIASATLNIRAAIIAVSLTHEDDRGVDWTVTLGEKSANLSSGATFSYGLERTAEGSATGNLTVSTKGLLAVLNSLSVERDIEILSQPQITSANLHTSALYSGSKIPFLGSVKSTTEETETGRTETEVTREIETTDEGILLQVTGDILDKTRVQVHVQPHITTIRGVRTFGSGENQSSAPIEETAQTNAIVTLESGQTLILGGVRTSSTSLEKSSILPRSVWDVALAPLLATKEDVISQKEYWVLLNVEIAEGPVVDALINEIAESPQTTEN